MIDSISTGVLTISIYLAFIAYENSGNPGWYFFSIGMIFIINTFFVFWCIKQFINAFYPILKQKIIDWHFRLFNCAQFKCLFNKETMKKYRLRKWMQSVNAQLKNKRLKPSLNQINSELNNIKN